MAVPVQVQCTLTVTRRIGYRSCYRRVSVWLVDESGDRCRRTFRIPAAEFETKEKILN